MIILLWERKDEASMSDDEERAYPIMMCFGQLIIPSQLVVVVFDAVIDGQGCCALFAW